VSESTAVKSLLPISCNEAATGPTDIDLSPG
jgi:hypothetical protein